MQAMLNDARRRLGTLAARRKAAEVRSKVARADLQVELDQDAFAKFDRLSRKAEMAEAEAESVPGLASERRPGDSPEPSAAPDASNDDLEIEAELEILKKKEVRTIEQ
jgi:phage shock protein A